MAVGVCLTACGGGNDSQTEETTPQFNEEEMAIVDYAHGANHLTPRQLDSLANNGVDDFTPGQGVGVLLYYNELCSGYSGRRRTETMRMFKDVYDIVLENDGEAFREAVRRAKQSTGVDLSAVYDKYRQELTGFDEASGVGEETEEKVDSAAIDSINALIVNHSDARLEQQSEAEEGDF